MRMRKKKNLIPNGGVCLVAGEGAKTASWLLAEPDAGGEGIAGGIGLWQGQIHLPDCGCRAGGFICGGGTGAGCDGDCDGTSTGHGASQCCFHRWRCSVLGGAVCTG